MMKRKGTRHVTGKIRWVVYWVLILLAFVSPAAQAQEPGQVINMVVDGPVTPVMLSYIENGIKTAEEQQAEALVISLDTPGGDVEITKEIIQAIVASEVPVIVYVSPSGARAASAGTFITMAGHVAAMAPHTSIGAASPVSGQGQEIEETLRAKLENILQADMKGLTSGRGPEASKWAQEAISEASAASAEEALDLGVVDFIARDLPDLLEKVDGFQVTMQDGQELTLSTSGAPVEELPMNWIEKLLHTITNPNIAFILLTLGINGILFELSSPGGFVAGVVGVICLLLAFYALGVLDVNYAGLLFIGLAFVLFVVDIKAPTHGVLTVGGIVAFVLGSLILFNSPFHAISTGLVISVGLVLGIFFAFVVSKAVGGMRRPVTTGAEAMVGSQGVVRDELAPKGKVLIKGEVWDAQAEGDDPIRMGEKIQVKSVERFLLHVTRQ